MPQGELLTIPFSFYLVWLMLQYSMYVGRTILKMLKPENHGIQISVKT